jgi:glutathione S-transferase
MSEREFSRKCSLQRELNGHCAKPSQPVKLDHILGGYKWLLGAELSQADITTAVAWRFTQHVEKADIPANDYPALFEYSVRAEALPEFIACPLSG